MFIHTFSLLAFESEDSFVDVEEDGVNTDACQFKISLAELTRSSSKCFATSTLSLNMLV